MTGPMVVGDGNTIKNKNDVHVRTYAKRVPFPLTIIIDHNSSSKIDDDACYGDGANNNHVMYAKHNTYTHTGENKETLKQGDMWKGDRVREQQQQHDAAAV